MTNLHAGVKRMQHSAGGCLDSACCKCAGMIKNWWAGVEALHNLFVKEHNHICKMLRKVGCALAFWAVHSCFFHSRTQLTAWT